MSLKRALAKFRGGIRKHQRKQESKQLSKLEAQRRRDERDAAKYERINKAKAAASKARAKRQIQRAPTIAARKKKVQQARVASRKAASGLVKAIRAFNSYANKR